MTASPCALIRPVLVCGFLFFPASRLLADGGVVRLRDQAGAYQVTVFTAPTPFRAGPVDISVLVLDADTGEYMPQARVTVRLTARGSSDVREYPATTAAATNKLFQAAVFELPEPGWWDVEVVVEGPYGPVFLHFEVKADEPLPRWLELWPWFAWPAVVVAFFCLHQVLVRRATELRPAAGAGPALVLSKLTRSSKQLAEGVPGQ
jgi:hypothetical protein